VTVGGPFGAVEVVDPGPLSTLQDRGRRGWAHLGVPRAGALDRGAAALARRLVGGGPDDAVIEARPPRCPRERC
jgi:allophanate hydrolase subunit 2